MHLFGNLLYIFQRKLPFQADDDKLVVAICKHEHLADEFVFLLDIEGNFVFPVFDAHQLLVRLGDKIFEVFSHLCA